MCVVAAAPWAKPAVVCGSPHACSSLQVLFQTMQHPMLKQTTGVVHTHTPRYVPLRKACSSALLLSCRSLQPLDLQQLLFAKGDLYFVLVNPKFEAPTAEMRAVLPKMVPMTSAIHNSSMGASLVSSFTAEATAQTHFGTAASSIYDKGNCLASAVPKPHICTISGKLVCCSLRSCLHHTTNFMYTFPTWPHLDVLGACPSSGHHRLKY